MVTVTSSDDACKLFKYDSAQSRRRCVVFLPPTQKTRETETRDKRLEIDGPTIIWWSSFLQNHGFRGGGIFDDDDDFQSLATQMIVSSMHGPVSESCAGV